MSPTGLKEEPVLYLYYTLSPDRPGDRYTNAKISESHCLDQLPNITKAGVFLGFPKNPRWLKRDEGEREKAGNILVQPEMSPHLHKFLDHVVSFSNYT